ncbi:MAG: hypothetical protein WAM97_02140 [Acidimicrobiales bacterium]|jgi:hypothetical protein
MDNELFGTGSDGSVPQVHPVQNASTPRRVNSWRRVIQIGVGVGVAAGVAVGATALASAATSSNGTPSASTTPTTTPSKGGPGHFGGGRGFGGQRGGFGGIGGFGGLGDVLHGEATVKGPNGLETIEFQNGTISSVKDVSGSTWSLVVTSSDKTAITYVVNSGTSVNGGESGISTVKTGDTVSVIATISSGTSTAKTVMDQTELKAGHAEWAPRGPQGSGPQGTGPQGSGPQGSGTTSPSGTSTS